MKKALILVAVMAFMTPTLASSQMEWNKGDEVIPVSFFSIDLQQKIANHFGIVFDLVDVALVFNGKSGLIVNEKDGSKRYVIVGSCYFAWFGMVQITDETFRLTMTGDNEQINVVIPKIGKGTLVNKYY